MSHAPLQVETYQRPAPPPDKPLLYASDKDKAAWLAARAWTEGRIAAKLGTTIGYVKELLAEVDRDITEGMMAAPEAVRARHQAYLQDVARVARREFDRSTKPGGKPDPRFLRIGMEALGQVRKIYGLDAPERSMSLNIQARTVISPEQQQALINDPEYRELVLAAEERERQLVAQGSGHVPGAIRGGGEPGQVVLRPPPGPPEPADDGRGGRPDPSPGHVHATSSRQKFIQIDVFPGVVPGHLPRSEGDLGQL